MGRMEVQRKILGLAVKLWHIDLSLLRTPGPCASLSTDPGRLKGIEFGAATWLQNWLGHWISIEIHYPKSRWKGNKHSTPSENDACQLPLKGMAWIENGLTAWGHIDFALYGHIWVFVLGGISLSQFLAAQEWSLINRPLKLGTNRQELVFGAILVVFTCPK
jgi:hypothetical protein